MLIKIVSLGLVVCFINIMLKKYLKEFVLPVEIVYLSTVIILLVSASSEIFKALSGFFDAFESGEKIFSDIVRASGICLLAEFSSDICTESGNRIVSDVINFSGRIMLVMIILPYIKSIIGVAESFIK